MNIRKADISDLDELTHLFEDYRKFYRQSLDQEGARQFITDRLSENDSTIFVAEDPGELIGFVQLYPSFSSTAMQRILILNDLFVDSRHRSKGVASALMNTAETYAKESGATRLSLATEMNNTQAQALYEKRGWVKNEAFLYYNKSVEI